MEHVDVAIDEVRKAEEQLSELSYQSLKASIAKCFTEAFQSGKVILSEKPVPGEIDYVYGPVNFTDWVANLPQGSQQHYNCRHCKMTFATLAGLAVISEDGSVLYPMEQAFLANQDDPIVSKALAGRKTDRKVSFVPIAQVHPNVAVEEFGGFFHFHAGTPDTVERFNKTIEQFADLKYVENLFNNFIDPKLDVDMFEKLFNYIRAEIGEKEHTALGRAPELITTIRLIRSLPANIRFPYLWSLLQKPQNGWLRHVSKSVLGIVFDAYYELDDGASVESGLHKVKAMLGKATSAENYKQKTAEASSQSVEQVFQFLQENELTNTLQRKLMHINDITSRLWVNEETAVAEAATEVDAVNAAYQKLMKGKDVKAASKDELGAALEKGKSTVTSSLQSFVDNLASYKSISISDLSGAMYPMMITDAAKPGNHDELLHFDQAIGGHALCISAAHPIQHDFAKHLVSMPTTASEVKKGPVTLDVHTVFVTRHHASPEKPQYVLALDNLAAPFYSHYKQHGTCILGTMFRSKHFDKSRVVTELAQQIPMDVSNGAKAAGGITLSLGLVLDVVMKDGSRSQVKITSIK